MKKRDKKVYALLRREAKRRGLWHPLDDPWFEREVWNHKSRKREVHVNDLQDTAPYEKVPIGVRTQRQRELMVNMLKSMWDT